MLNTLAVLTVILRKWVTAHQLRLLEGKKSNFCNWWISNPPGLPDIKFFQPLVGILNHFLNIIRIYPFLWINLQALLLNSATMTNEFYIHKSAILCFFNISFMTFLLAIVLTCTWIYWAIYQLKWTSKFSNLKKKTRKINIDQKVGSHYSKAQCNSINLFCSQGRWNN